MYRNINKFKVKYTDVDAYDILKPSALCAFLEECACLSADELGFGYKVIQKRNIGFVILNSYYELNESIRLEDEIEIHTWPLKPTRATFLRDFEIYRGGEKIGVATTRWCLIDTRNFSILPSSAFFEEGSCDWYNKERSIDFNDFKLRGLENGEFVYGHDVRLSDYDHYFHVNNTKYADFLLDMFDEKDFEGRYINSLLIAYVKQCKVGEIIDFYREVKDEYICVEGRVADEARVRFKVHFANV